MLSQLIRRECVVVRNMVASEFFLQEICCKCVASILDCILQNL